MSGKGHFGAARFAFAAVFSLIAVFLMAVFPIPAVSVNSPTGNFTINTVTVYANWSSGFVNVTSNFDYVTLAMDNTSTSVYSSYYQNDTSLYTTGSYASLTEGNFTKCFQTNIQGFKGIDFAVQNSSGGYDATNYNMSNGTSGNFTLSAYMFCPPGKYAGNITINNTNYTQGNDSTYLSAVLHIPMSRENVLNETAYYGWLKGKMVKDTQADRNETYHRYFMNTSALSNVSGFRVLMSGYTEDLDLFLFDQNGVLINQSINASNAPEEMEFVRLPSTGGGVLWEFRVFGNVTANQQYYNLSLYFSNLDVVNVSNTSQKIMVLDFGDNDANQTNSSRLFKLTNMDGRTIVSVNESTEVYYRKEWAGFNSTRTFTDLLVPNFTQRLEVRLEWNYESTKNVTNYTLYLRDSTGRLINVSQGKYRLANVTNGVRTEYITYEGPFNASNDGFWNITVVNETNFSISPGLSLYNVTAKLWFNASAWITTNFTAGTNFSGNGSAGSSYDVMVNITVPQRNVLDGLYDGKLVYSNGSGWKFVLPVKFNVSAAILTVNSSIADAIYVVTDNIGFNRTISFNITYNNTGSYTVNYIGSTSGSLVNSQNSSKYMNFTVSYWPGGSDYIIDAWESGYMNITVQINTNTTGNFPGEYMGWVKLNVSNSTDPVNSSYPYNYFLLNVTVNLSRFLTVNVTATAPSTINGSSWPVSLTVSVKLANGSTISSSGVMNYWNFTNVFINETNMTAYSIAFTGINDSDGSGIACNTSGFCNINATAPANTKGGKFNISVWAKWNTSESELSGGGSFQGFYVNEIGIYPQAVTSTDIGSITEGEYGYFNVSIVNYGAKAASLSLDQISFSKGSCTDITVARFNTNCTTYAGFNSTTYNYTLSALAAQQCWFSWKLTAGSVTTDKLCTDAKMDFNTNNVYANISGITLLVENNASSSDDQGSTVTLPTYNRSVWVSKHSPNITLKLGESNRSYVTVKNTGNISLTAKLSISFDNATGINATIENSSICGLVPAASCTFNITINVSNLTKLGLHAGTFKAEVVSYSSIYHTARFNLTVLSTPEREAEINISYSMYIADFTNLSTEFERIKSSGLVAQDNITRVQILFSQTNDTVKSMEAAMNASDYAQTEDMIALLGSQLSRLRLEVAKLVEEEQKGAQQASGNLWVLVVIGLVIAGAVGLFIYMMLPPSGYVPGKGYVPHGGEGKAGKVGSAIRKIFRRRRSEAKPGKEIRHEEWHGGHSSGGHEHESHHVAKYAKHYEKLQHSGYNYKASANGFPDASGIKSKFGGIFKRKRPAGEQMDVYSYMKEQSL